MDTEAVAAAAEALHGRPPEADEWADLLDFAGTEWVNRQGRTVAETLAAEPTWEELATWPTEIRTSLWVVDGHDAGRALLRDLVDDTEIAVSLPPAALAELPRRTVLRARVVPWRGALCFFGEPGLYGTPSVLERMALLAAWRAGGEPELLQALRRRRAGWARQRNQRRVFLAHFGRDLVEFNGAAAMEEAIQGYLDHLLRRDRGPTGGRPTLEEQFRAERGQMPQIVEVVLGPTLRAGRPAMCFDEVEGLLFLPSFGELRDHLAGRAEHADILDLWMQTNELPARGLALAGLPELALEELRRARPPSGEPSCFPELDPPEG